MFVSVFRPAGSGIRFLNEMNEEGIQEGYEEHLQETGNDRSCGAGNPALKQRDKDQADSIITQQPCYKTYDLCHCRDICLPGKCPA